MKRSNWLLILGGLFLGISTLSAQKISRDNYLNWLPSEGAIIGQTEASKSLHLFGDENSPSYEDVDPQDGIDDNRGNRLLILAAKFSPILYKNNFSAPRDFEAMLEYTGCQCLYSDIWEIGGPVARLVQSDTIALSSAPGNSTVRLEKLLQNFRPDSGVVRPISPESHRRHVLFFDFPGKDEKSWKQAYQQMYKSDLSDNNAGDAKIYAHPFLVSDSTGYEFVIQYWLFYPFNDAGNNHEGDWEHINVRVTTLERHGQMLTIGDLARILDHRNTSILDSLVIKKIDYYFHHFVMTLDYQEVNLQQAEKSFKVELAQKRETKSQQRWITEQAYNRLNLVKDTLNTHPIGYIGADNMGLDQLLTLPGGRNRNSHGTYPFAGIWKNVGPFGATEKVNGHAPYEFVLPSIYPSRVPIGTMTPGVESYKAIVNPKYLTYDATQIEVVPDWERVLPLALHDAKIARKWFWLMLPIRWGFPVAKSPGGQLMKHADLGQAAPIGPAYNSGWNRVGTSSGFESYDPHVLPSQFQMALQDNFFNTWGLANITYPTAVMLPGVNLVWFYTLSRMRNMPKFVTEDELPFRFGSFVYQPHFMFGNSNFARLLPQTDEPDISTFMLSHPGAQINESSLKHEHGVAEIGFMYNLHIGKQFSTEHAFSSSSSKVSYHINDATGHTLGEVSGKLQLNEITAGWRYSLRADAFQPFVHAGFGWTWYRVREIALDGEPVAWRSSGWDHKPGFWPNSSQVGAGIEYFFVRNTGLTRTPIFGTLFNLGKPDFGLRLSYTHHWHKLGDDITVNGDPVRIGRNEIGLGMIVGF